MIKRPGLSPRFRSMAAVVCLGLLTSQAVAFAHVFLSDRALLRMLLAIREAGYLAVPNQQVMATLGDPAPAFFGALFFTFTVGTGLTFLALAAALFWTGPGRRRPGWLYGCLGLWLLLLLLSNGNGFSPMASSYFFFIPPVVFGAASRLPPPAGNREARRFGIAPVLAALLLGLLWLPQLGGDFFLEVRDNLLLSNRLGQEINHFYYRYTLYPAQAFKSQAQKTLRSCNLEEVPPPWRDRLTRLLLDNDYLPLPGYPEPDLELRTEGDRLLLSHGGKVKITVSPDTFTADPAGVLLDFSKRSDRFGWLRQFTFISVCVALPLLLYTAGYTFLLLIASLGMEIGRARLIAALLTIGCGAAFLWPWAGGAGTVRQPEDIRPALDSGHTLQKVAALRYAATHDIDPLLFVEPRQMVAESNPAARYWYVKGLAHSRRADITSLILPFLEDRHPNVVCMALQALGRRGDRRAREAVLKRFSLSSHWYEQWYGYRALRDLGFRQSSP